MRRAGPAGDGGGRRERRRPPAASRSTPRVRRARASQARAPSPRAPAIPPRNGTIATTRQCPPSGQEREVPGGGLLDDEPAEGERADPWTGHRIPAVTTTCAAHSRGLTPALGQAAGLALLPRDLLGQAEPPPSGLLSDRRPDSPRTSARGPGMDRLLFSSRSGSAGDFATGSVLAEADQKWDRRRLAAYPRIWLSDAAQRGFSVGGRSSTWRIRDAPMDATLS
jgi:hypothetical protein